MLRQHPDNTFPPSLMMSYVHTPAGMREIGGQYRYPQVCVMQDGQWQLAAFKITPTAQPPPQ